MSNQYTRQSRAARGNQNVPVAAPGGGQPPMPGAPGVRPGLTPEQVQQQQQAAVERHIYRQPTDRIISDKFDEIIPDAKLYRDLLEAEKKLDATINRKKFDLQDLASRSIKKKQVLRVFIYNTVNDQPWQTASKIDANSFDFDTGSADPSWTLRIEGRLVDNEPADSPTRPTFNNFFTSIVVELEPLEDANANGQDASAGGASTLPANNANENNVIEWHEPAPGANQGNSSFDALDIRRKGDRNRKAKITMALKEYPNKFRLSPKLADILAIEEETKPGVVVAIWQYIKFHKLQDEDEKRLIRCDQALKELLGRETFSFPQIMELLSPHLLPRTPIELEYEIRVDKESTIGEVVYDFEIEKEEPLTDDLKDVLENWYSNQASINELDRMIAFGIQALNTPRVQRNMYKELASDPAGYIDRWVASQVRDLKVLSSDKGFNEEDVRQSSFYNEDILNQSVHLFLNSKH